MRSVPGHALGFFVLLAATADATSFVSRQYGFTMTPPSGWTHAAFPGFAAELFVAPGSPDVFRPNVNVLEPIATRGLPHAEVCQRNATSIAQVLTGARVTSAGHDSRTNVCEVVYTAAPNGTPLMFYAQLRFARDTYHTLTFTAKGPAEFQKWLPQVKSAFATFRSTR